MAPKDKEVRFQGESFEEWYNRVMDAQPASWVRCRCGEMMLFEDWERHRKLNVGLCYSCSVLHDNDDNGGDGS